jgi:7-carboxy-7-deazaguanine synthase
MDAVSEPGSHKIPFVEAYGPTIQGEGPLAGIPCHFIRVAGCDSKCSWCDTPYTVKLQPNTFVKLEPRELVAKVRELPPTPNWVVITGGNPALYDFSYVCEVLKHKNGYLIQVETQGTYYHPWLEMADTVVVSPKPPSSGKALDPLLLELFFKNLTWNDLAIKVVVFTKEDWEYAKSVYRTWNGYDSTTWHVSCGNIPANSLDPEATSRLGPVDVPSTRAGRYRWLAELVANDPEGAAFRVLPQLHVYAWGDERER